MSKALGLAAAILLLAIPALAVDCFDYASGDTPPAYGAVSVPGHGGHVRVAGNTAIVVFSYPYEELALVIETYDIHDPNNITQLGSLTGFAAAGISEFSNLSIVNGHAFFNSPFTWCAVDITDPANPVLDFAISGLDPGTSTVDGDVGYLTRGGGIVEAWDLSDPQTPQPLGSVAMPNGLAGAMLKIGDYLYVDAGDITLLDASDPANLQVYTSLGAVGAVNKMLHWGDRLFYVGDDTNLHSLDVSDPSAPVATAVSVAPRAGAHSYCTDMAVSGTTLYVSDYIGVRLYDIGDVDDPQPIGAFGTVEQMTWSVAVSDGALFSFGRTSPVHVGYLDCGSITAVEPAAPARAQIAAYPNPFNPRTEIQVELPAAQRAVVSIHDAQGRRLRTLFAGELPAGASTFTWDGTDDAGRGLSSGVYSLSVDGASAAGSTRLVLLR